VAERLVTGGDRDPFLPRLLAALRQANEIDLAVAFVKPSGLDLLFAALSDAMELRGARLRVLTSDYLDVTDPQALRQLLLLVNEDVDLPAIDTVTIARVRPRGRARVTSRFQAPRRAHAARFSGSRRLYSALSSATTRRQQFQI
jgi:hypothetical protein